MTVLNGVLLDFCRPPDPNPALAGELAQYDDPWRPWPDNWPTVWGSDLPDDPVSAPGGTLTGALISNLPVEANGRAMAGALMPSYFDDYYNRIHVAPTRLNLGTIVSTLTETFTIWNAYLVPVTLNALSPLPEGIALTAPAALPFVLSGNQETLWSVTVTPTGPARIEADIVFDFDAPANDPVLQIIGERIVAWGFAINWTQPLIERLSWLTDVLAAPSGAEQRDAWRPSPRREFEAEFLAADADRQALDLTLSAWSGNAFALPLYADAWDLDTDLPAGTLFIPCATARRGFEVGGLALLRQMTTAATGGALDVEAVEIAAIAPEGLALARGTLAAWPVGARLYPAISARLAAAPELTRITDRLTRFTATFRQIGNFTPPPLAAPLPSYRGLPVYLHRPNEATDLTTSHRRLLSEFDNDTGVPHVTDTARRDFFVRRHAWLLSGRAETAAFLALVGWLCGCQKSLWLPTHADDLTLISPASGDRLPIARCGYARFGVNAPGRQDILIERWTGDPLVRRVIAAVETSPTTEELRLDAPLPATLNPDEVRRISYLVLMRLADDVIEIERLTDADGVARVSLVFQGVREDLEGEH